MIGLVDSGICNLASVLRALHAVGAEVQIVTDPAQLGEISAIVLPGVGAFGDGMDSLRARGFVDPLRGVVDAGMPILGICLGMQLLLEESEEHGRHAGLGLLPGRVVRLKADQPGFRVPNIGWSDVYPERGGVLFPAGMTASAFYFVHSYYADMPEGQIAARIAFSGQHVAVAVEYNNICGVQFHPEKSQDAGLDLLARWVTHVGAGVPAERKENSK